ncbi:hypothetical protein NQZ68_002664 [Dissostichus eleginoides]|nr:hypothetical protein NQZ68_002664 [Dissostichus eleginoides]
MGSVLLVRALCAFSSASARFRVRASLSAGSHSARVDPMQDKGREGSVVPAGSCSPPSTPPPPNSAPFKKRRPLA